jgi:hypothetical protein
MKQTKQTNIQSTKMQKKSMECKKQNDLMALDQTNKSK